MENLAVILPTGVVSKNDIGAERTRERRRWWREREAVAQPWYSIVWKIISIDRSIEK